MDNKVTKDGQQGDKRCPKAQYFQGFWDPHKQEYKQVFLTSIFNKPTNIYASRFLKQAIKKSTEDVDQFYQNLAL